jgi:hypothetical protein
MKLLILHADLSYMEVKTVVKMASPGACLWPQLRPNE